MPTDAVRRKIRQKWESFGLELPYYTEILESVVLVLQVVRCGFEQKCVAFTEDCTGGTCVTLNPPRAGCVPNNIGLYTGHHSPYLFVVPIHASVRSNCV